MEDITAKSTARVVQSISKMEELSCCRMKIVPLVQVAIWCLPHNSSKAGLRP